METNIERVKRDLYTISQYNRTPGEGYTRFSYSPEDAKTREYLMKEFINFGLKVTVDAVGNIRARLEGMDSDAPVIMSGSHIDTVLHGGMFDGLVGTIGALEVVRTIIENKIKTKNPIEVVIFSEEEGSNFGSTTVGSKAMIGKYGVEDIKELKTNEGISMYEVVKNFGLEPEKIVDYVLKPEEIKAMIELHIEQSVVLDLENIPIGIVEAIAGIESYEIVLTGVSNHAGATPMHLRHDPMAAAAKVITAIERIAKESNSFSTVGTVGKIICEPNIFNVIPGRVLFTLDARDVNPKGIEELVQGTEKILNEVVQTYGITASMKRISESKVVEIPSEIVHIIEESADELGILYKRMNSGAVHDACILAEITDVGMIFVPSINGCSHVPEEKTGFTNIKIGCDLLLNTILKLTTRVN